MLLAAKFGIPVCPHAGGVGLCEYVQHLAIFDYIAVSGSLEDRVLEYVDHLHEHFVDPGRRARWPLCCAHRTRATASRCGRIARALRVPDGAAWTPARRRRGRGMSDRLAGKVALITGRRLGHRPCDRPPVRRGGGGRSPSPTSTNAAADETVGRSTRPAGAAAGLPGRRDRPGGDRGARRESRSRGSAASTSCSTTPGSPASASSTRPRSTCGTGSWPSTSVACSSSRGRCCRP